MSNPRLSGPSSPRSQPPLRDLLDRHLVIVTGKGGTGKTSVAAALGLRAAARGLRVCVVETGLDEHVPRLVAPDSTPGTPLRPGLESLRIDPYEALAEYLTLQLGVPGLATRVLRNEGFRKLLDAAPGWRELVTLGKVWHLREQGEFDLLLVDAPATGHGLTFLDVPRVVGSAVRAGPLRRHAGWVEEMVRDPQNTVLLPVALAEELPARETAELVTRLREDVGVPVDRVVANAVASPPFPESVADLDVRLGRIDLPASDTRPSSRTLAGCAAHLRSRYELNRAYLEHLREWTALPTIELPLLPEGVTGPADLDLLGRRLLGEAT